jgi:glycosyltransferase involved in cell wall biosynthesis
MLFLKLAKGLGFYDRVIWHASTVHEELEIRKIFGSNTSVFVAPNLVSLTNSIEDTIKPKKTVDTAYFVFISRISPKKNIHKALHFFQQLDTDKQSKIVFDIYGPIEDESYWAECKSMITDLVKNGIQVTYKGVLPYKDIGNTLSKYHFFVMLSWKRWHRVVPSS